MACSCNYCCSGKAVNITHCECVCVCVSVSVCNLSYTERNAHAPYGHLWRVRLHKVFPRCLTNDTIFERKFLGIKCRFRFSLQIWSETFLTVRELSKIRSKVYIGLCVKYPLFSSDFNETLVFSKYLRKNPQTKFHENLFSGSRFVPRGQTDGQT